MSILKIILIVTDKARESLAELTMVGIKGMS